MEPTARTDSFLSATVDVTLSTVGLWIVLFPAVTLANALLDWVGVAGFPLPDSLLFLLVGVIALGGAYPLVTGDWSLGRLGDFIFATTVCVLSIGLLGMAVVLAADLTLSGENPLPQAATVACGYVCAYLLVYRGGHAAIKRTIRE